MTYSDLAKKVACALIDADPTISGYHETHIAVKLPSARAAMAVIAEALREAEPQMVDAADQCVKRVGQSKLSFRTSTLRAAIAASPLLPSDGVAL